MEMEMSYKMQRQRECYNSYMVPKCHKKFLQRRFSYISTQCTLNLLLLNLVLSHTTITNLVFHWREILSLENENEDEIHGLLGRASDYVETDKCTLTLKRKFKRGSL